MALNRQRVRRPPGAAVETRSDETSPADQRCAARAMLAAKKSPASGGPGAGQVACGWPRWSKLEARDFPNVAPTSAWRQSTKMRSQFALLAPAGTPASSLSLRSGRFPAAQRIRNESASNKFSPAVLGLREKYV